MKKYVVFTKRSGYVFYICYTEQKGIFVSSDAPDNEVMSFDDKKMADDLAEKLERKNNLRGQGNYAINNGRREL